MPIILPQNGKPNLILQEVKSYLAIYHLPSNPEWVAVRQRGNQTEGGSLTYVLKGQTLENWNEMFSFSFHPQILMTAKEYLATFNDYIKKACPNGSMKPISQKNYRDSEVIEFTSFCPKVPQSGKSELTLYKVYLTKQGTFDVQRASRVEQSLPDEWRRYTSSFSLCAERSLSNCDLPEYRNIPNPGKALDSARPPHKS